MIKSTSLRSMDPDQVSIASSSTTSNKFASFTSRRQSLTRATASSLAKMVKMSSSDAQPPTPPSPTTTEKKKPSRFNKLLKRQSQIKNVEQQQLLPSPPDTPLPSVTTTNKKRASWSPFGLLRHNNHQYEPVSPASSLEDNAPAPQLPPLDPEDESGFLLDPIMNERRRSLAIGSSTSTRSSSKRHSTGSSFSHHQIQPSERFFQQSTPSPAPPPIIHPAEIQDSVELDVERTIALLEQEEHIVIEEPVVEQQQFAVEESVEEQRQGSEQQAVIIEPEEPVIIEPEEPAIIEPEEPVIIEQPAIVEHPVVIEQPVAIEHPVAIEQQIEQPVTIEQSVAVEEPAAAVATPEETPAIVEQVISQDNEPEAVAPTNASIAIMHPLFNYGDRAALVPTTEESSSLIQLVASCIAHADKLERLAQELSSSEYRVSELLQAHQSLIQSLDAREHRYKKHVATYQRLLSTQSRMLNELEDMLSHKPPSTTVYIPTHKPSWWQQIIPRPDHGAIYNEFGHTTDIVVAGTCVTAEPSLVPQQLIVSSEERQQEQGLLYHHYLLHIPHDDRSTKFKLMPEDKWIPDDRAAGCQFGSCAIQFGLLQRRHHCRSCGNIFCYKHSANQLPLFQPLNRDQGEWARVCDDCFYQLLGRS
ncbi:FYVE zinc finger-domain-containing protein [Fennellomyces sp. T-0311]|nr:FYVE zinc finger-domain-containing protein [Fennellomyces sp. T-0311]